jgi:hypothetical protein
MWQVGFWCICVRRNSDKGHPILYRSEMTFNQSCQMSDLIRHIRWNDRSTYIQHHFVVEKTCFVERSEQQTVWMTHPEHAAHSVLVPKLIKTSSHLAARHGKVRTEARCVGWWCLVCSFKLSYDNCTGQVCSCHFVHCTCSLIASLLIKSLGSETSFECPHCALSTDVWHLTHWRDVSGFNPARDRMSRVLVSSLTSRSDCARMGSETSRDISYYTCPYPSCIK